MIFYTLTKHPGGKMIMAEYSMKGTLTATYTAYLSKKKDYYILYPDKCFLKDSRLPFTKKYVAVHFVRDVTYIAGEVRESETKALKGPTQMSLL